MTELSRDEIESIRQQLSTTERLLAESQAREKEWEKLKDPANLHVNLLRGLPAILTEDMLKHLLGNRLDAAIAKAKREENEACAKVCDAHKAADWRKNSDGEEVAIQRPSNNLLDKCAASIRSRMAGEIVAN